MILTIPLPQILQMMTTTIATSAIHQLALQLLIADGARFNPIAMMIGPVTTGGKYFMTLEEPHALQIAESTRYSSPAQATPMQA